MLGNGWLVGHVGVEYAITCTWPIPEERANEWARAFVTTFPNPWR